MSGAAVHRSPGQALLRAAMLMLLFGILFTATKSAAGAHGIGTIAALGCLLVAGTLFSDLLETFGVPHLTGYLLAGILAGPHVIGFLDHHTTEDLSPINTLALALIALAGGAELRLETLRRGLKGLSIAMGIQSLAGLVVMTVVFLLARPLIPFARGLETGPLIGAALCWGAVAIVRSPSAALGVLSQTKASGPLALFSLNFIMTSDVVAVVLFAAVMTVSRTLIDGSELSLAAFEELGHHLIGSVSIGTTLGLLLALYLKLVRRQTLLVLVALGFGFTEVLRYLRFDPLLSFLVAGFVVQNLSRQGPRFLDEIEKLGSIVFVLFFASAGAHLDLHLLAQMWPVAVLTAAARAATTWGAGRLSSRLAADPPVLLKYGWTGLVSQAGLALGAAALVERAFPSLGAGFRALAIATIALNEMFGPILFKAALDRAGESKA